MEKVIHFDCISWIPGSGEKYYDSRMYKKEVIAYDYSLIFLKQSYDKLVYDMCKKSRNLLNNLGYYKLKAIFN